MSARRGQEADTEVEVATDLEPAGEIGAHAGAAVLGDRAPGPRVGGERRIRIPRGWEDVRAAVDEQRIPRRVFADGQADTAGCAGRLEDRAVIALCQRLKDLRGGRHEHSRHIDATVSRSGRGGIGARPQRASVCLTETGR